jgi:hypothetical protein
MVEVVATLMRLSAWFAKLAPSVFNFAIHMESSNEN